MKLALLEDKLHLIFTYHIGYENSEVHIKLIDSWHFKVKVHAL